MCITHLDGKEYRIQNTKGDIIQPNSMMTCEGLGMPFHKTPYKFGNLFIIFKVKFPEKVNAGQMEQFANVLSGQKKPANQLAEIQACDNIHKLEAFEESQKNTHAAGGTEDDHREDDDDEEGGPQQVGCQAQ